MAEEAKHNCHIVGLIMITDVTTRLDNGKD